MADAELIPLADGPAAQLLAPGLGLEPISPTRHALAALERGRAARRGAADPGPLFAPVQPDMFG
jgi:hypothetical protein